MTESREQWLTCGRPQNPGRLNDLRHIVYKRADAPWRRARKILALMLREGILKENIDGEAVLWAHNRLVARSEERRNRPPKTLSRGPGDFFEVTPGAEVPGRRCRPDNPGQITPGN